VVATRAAKKYLLVIALLFASCNPMRGCQESYFELQADSRLPKWFTIPARLSRNEVNVTLSYYAGPFDRVDNTVTRLVDRQGRTLATVTGVRCWHPTIDKIKRNKFGGFSGEFPRYVIMRTKDTFEVFDHQPPCCEGEGFRVTDEPAVVKEASDSIQRGECRQ
jgi:hypothetical protein